MSRIARIRIEVFRAPMPRPVVTSFGAIEERAIAMVAVEDADGAVGWGDIWGNFPSITTEYRARLAGRLLPDLLLGKITELADSDNDGTPDGVTIDLTDFGGARSPWRASPWRT